MMQLAAVRPPEVALSRLCCILALLSLMPSLTAQASHVRDARWMEVEGVSVPVPPAGHPRLYLRAHDLDDLKRRAARQMPEPPFTRNSSALQVDAHGAAVNRHGGVRNLRRGAAPGQPGQRQRALQQVPAVQVFFFMVDAPVVHNQNRILSPNWIRRGYPTWLVTCPKAELVGLVFGGLKFG